MSTPALTAVNGSSHRTSSPPPVFVVGCPRSGTTMLSGLLRNTPWGAPFETHFITKYFSQLPNYGDLSEFANFRRLMRNILSERPVQQWRLEVDIAAFHKSLESFAYGHIVDQLCRLHTAREGFTSWGDKTPFYVNHLDVIHALFPESRIIHIVRDGRDVALSLMRKEWGPANVYTCAQLWKQCNTQQSICHRLAESGLYHVVRYEDLLDEPQHELSTVLDFLGEPYQADLLSDLTAGVKRTNYDKWRTELTPRQIAVFESVAGGELEEFGYQLEGPSTTLDPGTKLGYLAHDRLKHARHLLYANVVEPFQIRFLAKDPFGD